MKDWRGALRSGAEERGNAMLVIELTPGRTLAGRLDFRSDLLEGLTGLCLENGIEFAAVQVIGALQGARLAVFDQQRRTYEDLALPGEWEIAAGHGNISLKGGRPFPHVHLVLSNREGRTVGGHLVEGCTVFACEFVLQELRAEGTPERRPDEQTGLALWPLG